MKVYFHFPTCLHGAPQIPIHSIIKSEISNRPVYNELRCITKRQGGNEYPTHKKKKEGSWIGHILCGNCLLEHVTEGKIEERIGVTGRRGRRRK